MYEVKLINDDKETIINAVSTHIDAPRITGTIKLGINTIDSFTFNIYYSKKILIKPDYDHHSPERDKATIPTTDFCITIVLYHLNLIKSSFFARKFCQMLLFTADLHKQSALCACTQRADCIM